MTPRWEHVVVVCPERVTGGPEALHQLVQSINVQGGKASLAYVWGNSPTLVEDGRITCHVNNSPTAKEYAAYQPRFADNVPLGPNTLVLFPEVLTAAVTSPQYGQAQRAVWWLSVDLALENNPQLHIAATRQALLQRDVIHFYQSAFAGRWLAGNGVGEAWPLSDYTPTDFRHGQFTPRRHKRVAVYLNRCNDLMVRFLDANLDLEYFMIKGMQRQQVLEGLQSSEVYLDFGSSSGKDRVPREAAASGCVVLLHNGKASAVFEDHPLAPQYKFTRQDVEGGGLAAQVRSILQDPIGHYANQAPYRWQVQCEPVTFTAQVQRAFFTA